MGGAVVAIMNHFIDASFAHRFSGAKELTGLSGPMTGMMTRLASAFELHNAAKPGVPIRKLLPAGLHNDVASRQFYITLQ